MQKDLAKPVNCRGFFSKLKKKRLEEPQAGVSYQNFEILKEDAIVCFNEIRLSPGSTEIDALFSVSKTTPS